MMIEVSIACRGPRKVTEAPPLGETLLILEPEMVEAIAEQRQLAIEFEHTVVTRLEEECEGPEMAAVVEGEEEGQIAYVVVKTDSASTLSTVTEMIHDVNQQQAVPQYKAR